MSLIPEGVHPDAPYWTASVRPHPRWGWQFRVAYHHAPNGPQPSRSVPRQADGGMPGAPVSGWRPTRRMAETVARRRARRWTAAEVASLRAWAAA